MKIKDELETLTTTQAILARALGMTVPRINAMIKEGIIKRDPADAHGGVLIFESLRNYFSKNAVNEGDADFNKERAMHERAKRKLAELKLQKALGNVYDAKLVERVIIEDLVKLRTRLLTIPSKIAPALEGKSKGEIDLFLTREIEETLSELSQYDPAMYMSEDVGIDESESV